MLVNWLVSCYLDLNIQVNSALRKSHFNVLSLYNCDRRSLFGLKTSRCCPSVRHGNCFRGNKTCCLVSQSDVRTGLMTVHMDSSWHQRDVTNQSITKSDQNDHIWGQSVQSFWSNYGVSLTGDQNVGCKCRTPLYAHIWRSLMSSILSPYCWMPYMDIL